MHAAVLQLAPILGAEKSKVPFYIAGGLLVVWALTVSLLLGMRKPDFPASKSQERGIIAITAVLVLAAVSTAVITSGGSTKTATTAATVTPSPPAESPPPPANGGTSTPSASTPGTSTPSPSTPAASTPPAKPTATTGTPAPPSSPAARPTTTTLALAANPEGQLSYNTKQLSAKPGPVTITMANMSPVEHNVTVAQGSTVLGATPTFQAGSRSLTLKLKPGTYTFYCSVPGHRQAGMEGTLTVSS
jgi:plastocyanin